MLKDIYRFSCRFNIEKKDIEYYKKIDNLIFSFISCLLFTYKDLNLFYTIKHVMGKTLSKHALININEKYDLMHEEDSGEGLTLESVALCFSRLEIYKYMKHIVADFNCSLEFLTFVTVCCEYLCAEIFTAENFETDFEISEIIRNVNNIDIPDNFHLNKICVCYQEDKNFDFEKTLMNEIDVEYIIDELDLTGKEKNQIISEFKTTDRNELISLYLEYNNKIFDSYFLQKF